MWQVESISAKNFMSFDEVSYDFKDKCYIIRAENKDNNGQQSNGGGKTSFVDILPIALLGYSLTGRAVKDCINWNTNLGYFEVSVKLFHWTPEYEIHSADPTVCEIRRKIYTKKSGELIILLNEEVPKNIPTKAGVENGVDVKEGNKFILKDILDITENDLLNYFLISKNHYNPFLEVNTDKKLEVIGRFTNTGAVDKSIEKIEIELEQDNDGIIEYGSKINQARGYIEALEATLKTDIEKDFIKKKESDIAQVQAKQSAIESEILDVEKSAKKLEEERDQLVEDAINEVERADYKKKLREVQQTIKHQKNQKQQLEQSISQIKSYLAGLITCPKCTHQFSLESENEFTQDDLTTLQDELEAISTYIDADIQTAEHFESVLQEFIDSEKHNKIVISERININRNIKSIEKQQERLLQEYDKFSEELIRIEARTFNNERDSIRQQIKGKEQEIESLSVQRKELVETIDKKTKWVHNFEDFKFHLGNKPISIICSLVNKYLKLSGSDLNLHIEGFKKLKSGDLRQALNPVIYRGWTNPQSYTQFSEGEKVRLNLATDLAFQQLINSSSKTGGLNFYQSDEMINSLDSEGVKNTAQAFNQLDKTIVLVTHSGADLIYENTVVIEKQNNVSSIL